MSKKELKAVDQFIQYLYECGFSYGNPEIKNDFTLKDLYEEISILKKFWDENHK